MQPPRSRSATALRQRRVRLRRRVGLPDWMIRQALHVAVGMPVDASPDLVVGSWKSAQDWHVEILGRWKQRRIAAAS
jgi:hypothetical protein